MELRHSFPRVILAPLSCLSLGLACGVLVIMIAASGALPSAIVHAAPIPACTPTGSSGFPCLIGPNLELVSNGTGSFFSGTGLCGGLINGLNFTFNTSATDPGFLFSGTPCTGSGGSGTSTITGSLSLLALNGYEIEDISGGGICGVTGGDILTLSVNSVVETCPSGASSSLSNEATFPPVTSLTETVALSNTYAANGTFSLSAISNNISLVATPEPSSWLMLSSGLVGLGFLKRKVFRN